MQLIGTRLIVVLLCFAGALPASLNRTTNIAGGTNACIEDYPYQVAIMSSQAKYGYVCSAVLISKRHVLTAKHCADKIYKYGLKNVYLSAGTSKIPESYTYSDINMKSDNCYEDGYYIQSRNIDRIDKNSKGNLAIISVDESFEFNDYVRKVDLQDVDIGEGAKCRVSGWGATKEDEIPFHECLQVAEIKTRQCPEDFGSTEDIICAGGNGGQGPCEGDDGGPLVCKGSKNLLTGIVSFGRGCGDVGGFVSVYFYRKWIKSII